MSEVVTVRPAVPADAAAMAVMHVRSWRETYRGVMRDAVLDDPGLPAARERFWTVALTDERYRANLVAVAEAGAELVGVAMSGPALDEDATWPRQLYVLYLLAAHHGSGGGAGLLDAVAPADEGVALWVADPNPRAQAFYRRRGFVADGTTKDEDGVHHVRMVRPGDRATVRT